MTRQPAAPAGWRRRTLLTGAAGFAITAGLGACATETSAIGASAGAAIDETPIPDSPSLLAVRTARNFGGTAPAGTTYSIFQAFAAGAVPRGEVARIAAGGRAVERQQCENRVAWPDGSLRCATFMWSHPEAIAPGGRSRITIHRVAGADNDAPSATLDALLAHDYQLQVVSDGVTYFLRANNEIRGGARIKRIRAGDACTAWKIWGDFRAGTQAGAPIQGQMWGKMFLYVHADGRIGIEDEIYCNKITNSAAIPITSYALLDGAKMLSAKQIPFTLFTRNKIATYDEEGRAYVSGPDVSRVVWEFPLPVFAEKATTGLYDAAVTWWNVWTPRYIEAFPRPVDVPYYPNAGAHELFPDAIDGTGNHNFLGPMTSVAVRAMLGGTYAQQRHDRLMALGAWSYCLFWCADSGTGYPPVLTATGYRGLSEPIPDVGWGAAPTLAMTGGQNPGTVDGGSHAGLWWWWQYLSTGGEQALENIMEQVIGTVGCNVARSDYYQRNPTLNGHKYHACYATCGQSREFAWVLRGLSNAHWVCPDVHAMKPYLNDVVQIQYDAAADHTREHPEWAALGIYAQGVGTIYSPGGHYFSSDSPWMDGYLATSICMDVRRGRIDTSHALVNHVIRYTYGKMVDGNFFNAAGAYRLGYGTGPNAVLKRPWKNQSTEAFAQKWSDVYGFSDPPHSIYPLIDTPPVTSGLRDQRYRGPYINPPKANPPSQLYVGHSYPNIALCAAECGVIAGLGAYPAKVVAYLSPLIDHASEAAWGAGGASQAWRIRAPRQGA